MNDLRKAAEMALKQLQRDDVYLGHRSKTRADAIEALRQALEQTEQEPVAMRYDFDGYGYKYIDNGSGSNWQTRIKDAEPLYAAPFTAPDDAVEAKLKERNT